MTSENFRSFLARPAFRAGEKLARSEVPGLAVEAIRMERMTALQKPKGKVRGIVAENVLKRLVGRTVAQQMMLAVERFTAPFQYALRTRAGTDCIAHVLTEADPDATVLSIDGVSAFDMVSRQTMQHCAKYLGAIKSCHKFVSSMAANRGTSGRMMRAWCTTFCKEKEREQGDPLMPLLFSLGIHDALQASQQSLGSEHLLAFLDDVYVVTVPPRVADSLSVLQKQLRGHSGPSREDQRVGCQRS